MNDQLKTILLTVLTLSCFVIALVELSGVSSSALFNRYHIGSDGQHANQTAAEEDARQQQAAAMPKTSMMFTQPAFNFGQIKEGDVVKHAYHFKNTGANPLLIYKAVASCGCTVPSFPRQPIPPGGEGDVLVQFDSHHKSGPQHKSVTVSSNAVPETIAVSFDAEVQ